MLQKIITIISSIIIFINAADGKECRKLLSELANEQTLFIYCITTHSVPVTMCIGCHEKHDAVLKAYDLLATNCTSRYFDKDRINLVASTESVLTGLWTKAYCDDCFNNNNSFAFDAKNQSFYNCYQNYKKDSCQKCKKEYMELNNFYINLDQHNNGEVCYDLQDSMNRTRNMWSKVLNCCRRDYNITLFTIALCITSSLPLLFYGTTYLITKRQERNHGVLNDEDPLYNSAVPSTSGQPTQSVMNNLSSASSAGTVNNNATSSTLRPSKKENFNILKEGIESSDDEMQTLKPSKNKSYNILKEGIESSDDEMQTLKPSKNKSFNILKEDIESSDDEINGAIISKDKLK